MFHILRLNAAFFFLPGVRDHSGREAAHLPELLHSADEEDPQRPAAVRQPPQRAVVRLGRDSTRLTVCCFSLRLKILIGESLRFFSQPYNLLPSYYCR